MSNDELIRYWQWFFRGSGGKAGFRRLINIWLIFHVIVGICLALLVDIDLNTASNTVLLPLIGILIGLSFAWAGNAQALMQSSEIDELSDFHKGGFVDYVFIYQSSILAILITLIFWGIAGLSIFDSRWPTPKCKIYYFTIKVTLYTLCSLTLRECWHVILGAQWMLLKKKKIKQEKKKQSNT